MQTNFLLKFEIFLSSTLTVVMEEAEPDIDFEDLILIHFYLARIYFLNLKFLVNRDRLSP